MEIIATITSRSGTVEMVVRREDRRVLVARRIHPVPLNYRRDWWGPESVAVAITDPGEGK